MKRYLNKISTSLPAPYHCTSCGSVLHWVGDSIVDGSEVAYWDCGCGEHYEIHQYSEEELERCTSYEDVTRLSRSEIKLANDTYIKAVLEVFNIDISKILNRIKVREIVMAREIIAYYLFTEGKHSVSKVGELLGHRATATAYHLIKLYENDVMYDKTFRKYLREIEKILGL